MFTQMRGFLSRASVTMMLIPIDGGLLSRRILMPQVTRKHSLKNRLENHEAMRGRDHFAIKYYFRC